ncbi:DNA mismatch repair endonuclease MutL [Kovacikia minuta CCNUW1]|uniref:DNA mismatch repair endonuclease MutL n=1 Tax=Kovacikia minuta TaxID=2931930 RepID=UPI001CCC93DD|nr:DNA mismatch repair endonuclease MutL [Kovacikia minuta]UBF26452.1 DNA mismatch repair endonuclease MutL [Kovacikia minuta CCNUW1]
MASGIQALPSAVVHLMAAGEVIDSLAAVVRELAENALDAGATRISISLYPDQWRIRIADNGAGMSLEDLQQAAAPHTTSKICSSQDLSKIRSLGFRGEALYSLTQLARLEIISRAAVSTEGWWIAYDTQGKPIQIEPAAIAPGTIVTVSDIFAAWSVRREGLPPLAQQLKTVQTVIYQLALCHPHVTWQVEQNDRDWFNLWMGKTARQILPQILRDVQVNDLQELQVEVGEKASPSLYLLLGLPDRCHRHRSDWVRVALNGRFVQILELEQAILSGFRRTLPRDRFPVCFVHLHVPPDQIDWNRHPAKSEVYLHHLNVWREQVTQAIDQALRLSPINLSDTFYSDRVGNLLKTAESEGGYYLNQRQKSEGRGQRVEGEGAGEDGGDGEENPLPTPYSPLPTSLRAIAQLHNTYILAEHPSGVWLIEQHIAHERVLYEQLCDRWRLMPLSSPITLSHLSPHQVAQLQRLELEIEPFGEQIWMVRTAPELLAQRQDCSDALIELSLGGDLQTAQVATACRSAIRNGTSLTLEEMQILLNQWQQTRNPRTCPHGRPICLTLEESSLARFFRRHWVIGKSHGI